jgi:dihydrofolate reductase
MRRIVTFNRVSADGYFSAADGNLDWTVPDDELDGAAAEAIERSEAGAMLFGRRTYEMFESFWPHALDDPNTSPDPHGPGRRSKAMRAMAIWINLSEKIVFSKTRKDVTWQNSRLLREIDAKTINELKRAPGDDILLFGSGSVVSRLSELGLIDEYRFIVCPVLLGSGKPLLHGISKRSNLRLVESKASAAGNVMLRYELSREK